MMNTMMHTRPLAALICAVTVLVTAQFLPSVAQAHSGHDHASSSIAVTSSNVADPASRAVDPAGPTDPGRSEPQTEFVSASPDSIPTVPAGACNGSCCGKGAACCGAVFLFPPAVALPDVDIARQPVVAASSVPPGVDPDALRKPPKSLA
jgi:hypothetical protein